MAIANDGDSSSEGSSCQDIDVDAPTDDLGMKERTANTGKEGGSSSDDSSDDGGFLESWLEAEKKKSESDIQKDIQISQNDKEDIPNKEHEQVDETMNNTMQLGDSVLQWIESTKRKKRSYNDYGIWYTTKWRGNIFPNIYCTLKLTKPNTKKRSRTGTEQSEVLIEESRGDVKKCGQIVQSEEGMVDCLARYDKEKGCYVLEKVNLLVRNLQSSTAEAVPNEEEAACDKEGASTEVDRQQFDPLTKAKRAEQQIKKLKKGKRTSSTKEMRRDSLKPNI